MNRHRNGTIIIGQKGSYQYLLSALTDLLKGKGKNKPKSYEVYHIVEVIKKTGIQSGISKEQIQLDYENCHVEANR